MRSEPQKNVRHFQGSGLKSPTLSDLILTFMFRLSFFTGGIAQTNGWLLETDSAAVVFDAPEGMADWLASRDPVRASALVLTHQHFDHVLDAARIRAAYGCPVFAFAPFSRDLTLERLWGAVTGSSLAVEAFEVDEVLEGRDAVTIGGLDWQVLHIPGHSPDSICLHQAALRIVFGGDVLFLDGIGRTDFPGGSTEMLLSGIEARLLNLPDDTRVFPGHGDATTIGRERLENPFLQDGGW